MPDIVINTGPIIALTAGVGSLDFLESIYDEVVLPREVFAEIVAGGPDCVEAKAVRNCKIIHIPDDLIDLPAYLKTQLDSGEASVVETALVGGVPVVAIDEKSGRRIARLHGLKVTGSVGILVKACQLGVLKDLGACFRRMRDHGVWIKQEIIDAALSSLNTES